MAKANQMKDECPLLPQEAPDYTSITKETPQSREQSKSKLSGQSSLIGVMFNFLNALVGAAVLGVPISYAKAGIFGGIGLMIMFAVINTYTLNLLMRSGKIINVVNYEDLGYSAYGYWGYCGVSLSILMLDYGVMITYLIVIGDSAQHIASIWGYSSQFDRQIATIVVALIVIFPLCLRRDISHMEIFSFFKFLALSSITLVILYECFHYYKYSNVSIYEQHIVWFDINGIPFAVGIYAFAFVCHDIAFLFYNSLKNPTLTRYTTMALGGFGSAMMIMSILSIPAYLTFTDKVDGNILNNYQVKGVLIVLVRVTYIFALALTYPLPLFVVRHICYAIYIRWKYRNNVNSVNMSFEDEVNRNVKSASSLHHIVLSSVIFFSSLTISMFVDNLGVAMSIIGCISSMNLAFVFPCLFYIKVSKHKWSFWREKTANDALTSLVSLYPPLVLSLFGGVIGIYCVIIIIKQTIN